MNKKIIKNFLLLQMCFFVLFIGEVFSKDKNMIYIYKDEGVSKESFLQTKNALEKNLDRNYEISTIDSAGVKDGEWQENAKLFIMPGGADLPYVKKLNGIGNKKIIEYVLAGGSFLGICAGSYYASSYVEFDKNGPLEVLGARELKFFEGKAIGPVLALYDYKSQKGSRAAKINLIFEEVPSVYVYYNGGGYFKNADKYSNTKIIAKYENDLASIISIDYGKGVVVLSGVHFEYDPLLLNISDPYIAEIINPLINDNKKRIILFHQLLKILKI